MAHSAGSTSPQPIPDAPVDCRGCGAPLPPLRRWGGMCKQCVADMPHAAARPDPGRFRWTELTRFKRVRGDIQEWMVAARCECGAKRTMTLSIFNARRTCACKACLLKSIHRTGGVESDYAK